MTLFAFRQEHRRNRLANSEQRIAMIKAVRGTRDLLPSDTDLWNRVEAKVRDVFARYNYREIRTPVFEDTGLFIRSVGENTDIVTKEMFTWLDSRRPAEKDLMARWLAIHSDAEYADAPQGLARRIGYDLIVNLNGHPTLVEFKLGRPNQESIRSTFFSITRAKEGWRAAYPSSPDPDVRLVVPASRHSSLWQKAATQNGVILEEIDIEDYEDPQSLTLRPENTAGVVRAYIEHGLDKRGSLQKLYYIGPQFRRERPQKGRYRQFYQIGAEIIGPPSAGSESPARDAEVLEMLATLLDEVGLRGWQLQLNSVGCAADRARYDEALREALKPVVHQMCADCQRRAETNPLRVLDCKVPEDQPIIEKLPKISEYLDEPCREHFAVVRAMLDAVGVPYTINERMVRGLDYYTRTTFEFTHGDLGAQSAVLGGGRYDGLSESLDGPKAPGIGFAIGEDRLILALQAEGVTADQKLDAYIAPLGAGMNAHALKLARELRRAGVSADIGDENFRLKKSFEAAEKAGAKYIVIVGENEAASGEYAVKDLATGKQEQVGRAELSPYLSGTRPPL
jgi:histidyl-tRNA synthetase